MKINFTKQEYLLLVEMLEVADWVLHSHDAEQNPETQGHADLRNKILAYAEEMGMKGCYVEDEGTYFETGEYEENSTYTQLIDRYDEDTFWDQLIDRLTDRDLRETYGDVKADFETQTKRHMEIESHYIDEFEKNGISNLRATMAIMNTKLH
jgi:hypothetical protein